MRYPSQLHAFSLATIQRERMLPRGAIGTVEIRQGERADLKQVVARGTVPTRHVILEASSFFKLKRPEDLDALMLVERGDAVEINQPIAGRNATRGRRLFSPVYGIIAYIGDGRIVLQETPEVADLEAGMIGTITEVIPGRGVIIESTGGLIQGVWGNNQRVIGPLRPEPEDGLESIRSDELNTLYRGAVVLTRKAISLTGLRVVEEQGLAGVIAPSMDITLREPALDLNAAILLTEGFGAVRMSAHLFNMAKEFDSKQVTIDATGENGRPEAIINFARSGLVAHQPDPNLALKSGMVVRLTRAPYMGQTARIVNLPDSLRLLDNGLRVQCAEVELFTGEVALVPLANLESFGS